MKKALFSIVFTILSIVIVNAQELGLKEIVKKHLDAVGQEKLSKVNTIKMTGKQMFQGMELPFTIYMKRPGKIKIEADVNGSTFVQAFNGTAGFMIVPMSGSTDPQDLNESQLNDMKSQADIDDKLFDAEKKGNTIELIGTEQLDGNNVYKLKFSQKPATEGGEPVVTTFYIDASNFAIIKTISKKNMGGNEVEMENLMTNFKQVESISWPFSIETKAMGNTMSNVTIENVTLNEEMADDIFERPTK